MRKYWSFKKSRVKYNFDEWKAERSAETRRKRNGEKARAFLLQTEKICTKETQAIQRNSKRLKRLIAESSSEQEHKVNALASGAEEGRDKLR